MKKIKFVLHEHKIDAHFSLAAYVVIHFLGRTPLLQII